MLTVSSADEVDSKTRDLYNKFNKGCMSFLLDRLLDAPFQLLPPQNTSQASASFSRSSLLLTSSQLTDIVCHDYERINIVTTAVWFIIIVWYSIAAQSFEQLTGLVYQIWLHVTELTRCA